MNTKNRYMVHESSLNESDNQFSLITNTLISKVESQIEQRGLTRRDLAVRMGKSPSQISKMLSGSHNLTIKSVANLMSALDQTVELVIKPKPKRNSHLVTIKSPTKPLSHTRDSEPFISVDIRTDS